MRAREASQQLSLWPEKRMRPVEGTYGDLMGHDVAESLARKPAMEMEGGRLDLEGGFAQLGQIEIDGMVRGWADRGRHARKHSQCRAMDMPRCDLLHAGMTAHDGREFACVEKILAVHMPNARLERRMVQKQQRRPIGRRRQSSIKPLQCRPVEFAMRLSMHA